MVVQFYKWFHTAKTSDEASFSIGYLVSIKILPILADLGIAGLIYWVAKLSGKVKYPILWASIFLFFLSAGTQVSLGTI